MIDTVDISHKLQAAGLPQNQADVIAQSFLEVPRMGDLVTKSDLAAGLATLKAELLYWFVGAFLLNAIVQIVVAVIRH